MILFLLFIIGICVGSFLLVVVDRIPKNESIFLSRSRCDFCKRQLGILDLVPLFSFALLGGRCRYCHKRLSLYYPAVELATGIFFILTYIMSLRLLGLGQLSFLSLLSIIFYFFITCMLLIIFLTDIKYGIIPFVIVLPASFVTLFFAFFVSHWTLSALLIPALGSFSFLFLIFVFTKGRGMGFGDVVFALFMGLLLGYPGVVYAHYIAFLTGAVVSLILILTKKKKIPGGTIPFGPFLVVGTYISLFLSDEITMIIQKFLLT